MHHADSGSSPGSCASVHGPSWSRPTAVVSAGSPSAVRRSAAPGHRTSCEKYSAVSITCFGPSAIPPLDGGFEKCETGRRRSRYESTFHLSGASRNGNIKPRTLPPTVLPVCRGPPGRRTVGSGGWPAPSSQERPCRPPPRGVVLPCGTQVAGHRGNARPPRRRRPRPSVVPEGPGTGIGGRTVREPVSRRFSGFALTPVGRMVEEERPRQPGLSLPASTPRLAEPRGKERGPCPRRRHSQE